ncbi:unnamed protein product [Meganyctiphanes norvegica]|uniref:Uncharacterized protein n=1 Tax=Meganyctiphanes norvegica TaxID=48144 RepID=A0AAV2QF76_MEGNR
MPNPAKSAIIRIYTIFQGCLQSGNFLLISFLKSRTFSNVRLSILMACKITLLGNANFIYRFIDLEELTKLFKKHNQNYPNENHNLTRTIKLAFVMFSTSGIYPAYE